MEPLVFLAAAVVFPTLFFLPGFLTFHTFRVDKSDVLPPLERVMVQVLLSVLVVGALALLLAVVGFFSIPALLIVVIAYGIVLLGKTRFRPRVSAAAQSSTARETAFVLSLMVMSGVLFFRPFEDIWGFGDAYAHVMIGVSISKHGAIIFHDELLTGIPEVLIQQFLFRPRAQFNGFVVTDLATGQISPRFLHLNGVWIAILYSLTGLRESLYLTPLFGTLSITLLYFAGKRQFGWKVGAVASLLLTLSYLQVWFSRSHSAEILLQFLLIGGILMFVLAEQLGSRPLAVASASSFGLSMATGIEAVIIVLPVALVFSALKVLDRSRPHHDAFFQAFSVSLILVLLYYAAVAWRYVTEIVFWPDVPWPLLAALLGVTLAPALLPAPLRATVRTFIQGRPRLLQHVVAGGLVAFVLYSLATYPNTPVGRFGRNLEMLGWYLTPLIVGLGILGIILLVYRTRTVAGTVFLGVSLVFFLYFVATIQHAWGGPWWMRRYIFAAVPLLFLGTGTVVDEIHRIFAQGWGRAVPTGLLVLLLLSTVAVSYPVYGFVQYGGSITQIESVFESYGEDDILVFADLRYPHAAVPLRYVYGKEALLMRVDLWGATVEPRDAEDVANFVAAVAIWKDQGKRVFVVNPSGEFQLALREHLAFSLHGEGRIEMPYLQFSTHSFPTEVVPLIRHIRVFEVHMVELDVGASLVG